MRTQILVSAQRLVQQRGFNGFSYADIAEEVGIRKASVHHHFPTKTDLAAALIESYTAQVQSELARIGGTAAQADAKLKAYIAVYRGSLTADRMCLCGMLASEWLTLDPALLPNITHFFALNTEWLTEVLATGKSQGRFAFNGAAADHARMLLAALQGALLIARATSDRQAFDRTTAVLIAGFLRSG